MKLLMENRVRRMLQIFVFMITVLIGSQCLKPSIYDLTEQELTNWMTNREEKAFRSSQVWRWLYQKRVNSFDEMTELNKSTRALLDDSFSLSSMEETKVQRAKDGTIKCLLKLHDGNLIETVMMEQNYGLTICVTTQVGCNIGCTFCASGLLPKKRDLTAGEIVQQILHMQKKLDRASGKKRIRNIVIMGTGEPFDNYDNVLRFIRVVNHAKGLAIGARHITVSTSGLDKKIKAFAEEDLQVNLALSLHAANNALRTRIMKLNRAVPIEKLMNAIDYYLERTDRRVTFEYILLKDVNDFKSCALDLADLISARSKRYLIHVNIIPYNPVDELDHYKRSRPEVIRCFIDTLREQGIHADIRANRGADIDAACGQLRSKQIRSGS